MLGETDPIHMHYHLFPRYGFVNESEINDWSKKYQLNKKYLFFTGSIFNRRHVLELIKAFSNFAEEYQFLISGRDITKPAQNIDKKIEKINKRFPNAIKRVNENEPIMHSVKR